MRIAAFMSVWFLIIGSSAFSQQAPGNDPAPTAPAAQPAPSTGSGRASPGQAGSAQGRQFRLILLDDANQPVERAEVEFGSSPRIATGQPKGRTDALGRCTIDLTGPAPKYWRPKITKPGYIPLQTWMSDASIEKLLAEETTLRMTKGLTIGGVIKDEAGKPIKGVVLGFYWSNPNRGRQPVTDDYEVTQVRTDADGKWVCDFAPPQFGDGDDDNFRIFLRHPEYVSDHWASGYIPGAKYPRPSLKDLLAGTAVYVMKRGQVLTGKITDKQGKPVARASVTVLEPSYCPNPMNGQRTKADGAFEFRNLDKSCNQCVVTAKGLSPQVFTFNLAKGEPLAVTLEPGGLIRGKVVDARGLPIAGAFVAVDRWRGDYSLLNWSTQTDKDGCFTWTGAPIDGVTLRISRKGYMEGSGLVVKLSEEQQLITLNDPLRISGQVIDAATGKPIDGATIIQGIDWGRGSPVSWERRSPTGTTGGKYQMEITDSYPGYVLRAEADGYKPAVSESIPRDAGRRTVDFSLHKCKPIIGRVLDPDGKPLAGVEVHAATADERAYIRNGMEFLDRRNAVKVTTAADGSFSFPPGDKAFTIVVLTDAGYAEVSGADLLKSPLVRLAPWGRIEGIVKQGSKPLPKASVGASTVGSRETPTVYHDLHVTADARGRFVMPRVPPGQYQVHRMMMMGNVGFYICHERVTVEVGKAATVTLGGKGRMVVGKLCRDVGDGEMNRARALILDAASMAIGQQMVALRPTNWDKMDAAQQDKWAQEWRQSEEGKAFTKLSQEVQKKSKYIPCVLQPDGKLEAWEVPPGQYVLNVSLGRDVTGNYVSEGTVQKTFEVPVIKGNDLDTPLDLGTLEVESPVVMPADNAGGQGRVYTDGTKITTTWTQGPAAIKGGESPAGLPAQPSSAAGVLNQPLKLELGAGLAGKKLLVVAASIEQRPSRRLLDTLAAQADAIAKQGFAIVLVQPAVTDETQVRQWLKDHKLDVAQVIVAKDEADVAKLTVACGAESLPSMLLASDKHVVTVVDVQADKLGMLGEIPDATTPATQPAQPAAAKTPGK